MYASTERKNGTLASPSKDIPHVYVYAVYPPDLFSAKARPNSARTEPRKEQAMTGHQIDNFVGSLVEMAKAFEERPVLQRMIREQETIIEARTLANVALEDSNAILRGHIDELNAKLAEVSKERDDASFRVLEVEDKASRVLDLARTLQTGLGQVIAELEPPKPEPVSVQADPTMTTTETASTITESPKEDGPAMMSVTPIGVGSNLASPSTGQSEPFPPAHGVSTESLTTAAVLADSSPQTASHTEAAASTADKPYAGRRWSEFGYLEAPYNRDAWFAGGGDEEGWVS